MREIFGFPMSGTSSDLEHDLSEAGERFDALQRHIRQQHPDATVPSANVREVAASDASTETDDSAAASSSFMSTPIITPSELQADSSGRSLRSLSQSSSASSSFTTITSSQGSDSLPSSPAPLTPSENELGSYLLHSDNLPSNVDLSMVQMDYILRPFDRLPSTSPQPTFYDDDYSAPLSAQEPPAPGCDFAAEPSYTSLPFLSPAFEDFSGFSPTLQFESPLGNSLYPDASASFEPLFCMPYETTSLEPLSLRDSSPPKTYLEWDRYFDLL